MIGSARAAQDKSMELVEKQASRGFSERALRSQEHVIEKQADLMVERSKECAAFDDSMVRIGVWCNVSWCIYLSKKLVMNHVWR